MTQRRSIRARRAIAIALALAALAVTACGAPSTGGGPDKVTATAVPTKPSKAVTLNILDIAGNLQLTKGMIDAFQQAHPDIVAKVSTSVAPSPQMASKLKAQQAGGNVTTSMVLSGTDGLSAGIANNLLTKVLPDLGDRFPGIKGDYLDAAAAMQQLAQGYGVALVYYPSGPLLEYQPAKVSDVPGSPAALLTWAKAHPNKFEYAQPANSGPGRTFLMGLPYALGDKDPSDPVNGWDKTWAYLKELGKYIKYYPTGTTDTMKDLASGAVDMVASTTGWDINPRVLGTVPNTTKVTLLQPMTWVTDAQYALIPKGVSKDVLAADLQLISFMLKPEQQAKAYDDGYFYPGPAVKGVTLSMAPAKSQQALSKYGRSEYATWIDQYPKKTSLPADVQVKAFDLWNQKIGSAK